MWQVERVSRPAGEMYEYVGEEGRDEDGDNEAGVELREEEFSPLMPMNDSERLMADFNGTGMTVGPHPMVYCRKEMDKLGVRRAYELARLVNGMPVRVAGAVICRQRPGTAKGFVFLSMEDETGVANVIITPQLFEHYRVMIVGHPFLIVEGKLQHQDNVISVKAESIYPLSMTQGAAESHDFH